MDINALEKTALSVRSLAMDAIQKANSGHPGVVLGAAELGAMLYGEILRHDPSDPKWPDRDRFVLSAGHGSMFLYSLLHLSGYADMTMDVIKSFRQVGSPAAGHPKYGAADGIEMTTGPLGQGLATAVGMAVAETMLVTAYSVSERSGRYIHFGIREFAMAAVANGISLHGGFRSFCAPPSWSFPITCARPYAFPP